MMEKLLSLVGFAKRAGKIVSGFTAVERGIRSGKVSLVLIDEAIGKNTEEKIVHLCHTQEVPWCKVSPASALGQRIGKSAAMLAGITDEMFAENIMKLI